MVHVHQHSHEQIHHPSITLLCTHARTHTHTHGRKHTTKILPLPQVNPIDVTRQDTSVIPKCYSQNLLNRMSSPSPIPFLCYSGFPSLQIPFVKHQCSVYSSDRTGANHQAPREQRSSAYPLLYTSQSTQPCISPIAYHRAAYG